jgi:hypothetical protein
MNPNTVARPDHPSKLKSASRMISVLIFLGVLALISSEASAQDMTPSMDKSPDQFAARYAPYFEPVEVLRAMYSKVVPFRNRAPTPHTVSKWQGDYLYYAVITPNSERAPVGSVLQGVDKEYCELRAQLVEKTAPPTNQVLPKCIVVPTAEAMTAQITARLPAEDIALKSQLDAALKEIASLQAAVREIRQTLEEHERGETTPKGTR